MIDKETKNLCLRLRSENKLRAHEISKLTGVDESIISLWCRGKYLSEEEIEEFRNLDWGGKKRARSDESRHFSQYRSTVVSKHQKGKVSEAAIMFRLALNGFTYYTSPHDSDSIDFIIHSGKTGKTVKLQVRSATAIPNGRSKFSIFRCSGYPGAKRYQKEECDAVAVYDPFSDEVYVYAFSDLDEYASHISVSGEHLDRWDKIRVLLGEEVEDDNSVR